MIAGIFHQGSGLGNQLHRYVAARVLAMDKRYEFGMVAPELFKGDSFMKLDMGLVNNNPFNHFPYSIEPVTGKVLPRLQSDFPLWEEKTNYYNPEFNFIEDNTIIDGEFQSAQYFGHRMDDIHNWLDTEYLSIPNDVCVIGFRGGEFYMFPELGLPREYFEEGIKIMKKINPKMRFEVHTDDKDLAGKFFPDYPIIQNMEINWRSMRYARYAIIANSSFYILPRLLSLSKTIAPRWWARRNIGEWSRPDNYYREFEYI